MARDVVGIASDPWSWTMTCSKIEAVADPGLGPWWLECCLVQVICPIIRQQWIARWRPIQSIVAT